MIVCISPYLLTARSPAALASLLIADEAVTVMPTPEGAPGPEQLGEVAGRVPSFHRLMEAWSWSLPLWHAGVIRAASPSEDAMTEIRRVRSEIETDDRFAPMRPLMHAVLERTDDGYLNAFAADLLKAGPDPAIGVPVSAGLDRFAAARGLIVVRGEPASIAARQELAELSVDARVAVPILTRTNGQRLVVARAELEPWLDELRDAVDEWSSDWIREAASAYAHAFEERREELCRCTDPDDPPVRAGMASITLGEMRADAVLHASSATAGRLLGHGQPSIDDAALSSDAIVRTMIIRQIGAPKR